MGGRGYYNRNLATRPTSSQRIPSWPEETEVLGLPVLTIKLYLLRSNTKDDGSMLTRAKFPRRNSARFRYHATQLKTAPNIQTSSGGVLDSPGKRFVKAGSCKILLTQRLISL
jgi:hypothetical protein